MEFWILTILILIGAGIMELFLMSKIMKPRHLPEQKYCRLCSTIIHYGGHAVKGLGAGYCYNCSDSVTNIIKEKKSQEKR